MNEPQKKPLTKTEVIAALAAGTGLTKQQVNALFDELVKLIGESLQADGPGVFNIPGLMKVRVVRKPAELVEHGGGTVFDAVKSTSCQVFQGMRTEGIMSIKPRFQFPGNIWLQLNSVTPILHPENTPDAWMRL